MNFAPLHNHSEYSALDGLSTCREIAQRCQEIGCTCCAITDHATVAGHLEFAKVMLAHDIKPIFGCELYHGVKTEFGKNERDQAHFVVGALTDEGLRNVWRLVSAASTNYRYVGRVNWDMLAEHREGLFATSACISGLVPKGLEDGSGLVALNKYLEIYRDNFYIELHCYPDDKQREMNLWLADVATERGVPVVYATDAHFASPDQYELHDLYVAMSTGDSIYTPVDERKMWHPEALFIKDEQQIRESLDYLPESVVDEALSNSAAIAEMADARLPEVRRHLPAFIPSECPWLKNEEDVPETAAELFIDLVEKGIVERYGEDAPDEVWDRATREMEVFFDAPGPIEGGGLEHYFLQAWDFCEYCNQHGIQRGPGRGSAAGSLVAYALGITDVDPLYYGLSFERFYNPGRAKGFPDIDNDFPVESRKKVRDYLKDRWGHDKVRTIGTTMRMKPKSVLDKTFRACGVTDAEKNAVKRIVAQLPDIDILGADSIGWTAETDPGKTIYVMHSTPQSEHDIGEQVEKWITEQPEDRQDVIRYWLEIVSFLCSRVSGYGVHPSGVVVSDVSLDDELPCMFNRNQEERVTCFPMDDVDKRMFVKQDLLGLKNLDILQDWEKQVEPLVGEIKWSGLEREITDEEIYTFIDRGITLGLFQIEDGGAVRKLAKDFKPRSVEDLCIIVALNRPGPLRSGAAKSFVERRWGREEITYDHPILEDVLDETYGWFLYQEQVIRFFVKLGLNESDADAVRKILGKKDPEAWAELYRGEGEWKGKGYSTLWANVVGGDEDARDAIWAKLEDFAKYSYNKSHALSYAILLWRTAFAKTYGTPEFVMAGIRMSEAEQVAKFVAESKRVGVEVLPPDILKSGVEIGPVDGAIYYGLSNIKGIGKGTARYIVKLRENHDISSPDLLADAMDAEQMYWEERRDRAKEFGDTFKEKSPRQQFNAKHEGLLYEAGCYDAYGEREDVKLAARQKAEKELLGVILSDNSAEIFTANADLLENADVWADVLAADEEDAVGTRLTIPGVVSQVDPKQTKKDKKAMGIVTIEYEGDELEIVVFPQAWGNYRFLWKERTAALFTVKKNDRGWAFEEGTKLS